MAKVILSLEGSVIREVSLDKERVKLFKIGGKAQRNAFDPYDPEYPDEGLAVKFQAPAGMHTISISMNQDVWKAEGTAVGVLPLTNNGYSQGRDTTAMYGRDRKSTRLNSSH